MTLVLGIVLAVVWIVGAFIVWEAVLVQDHWIEYGLAVLWPVFGAVWLACAIFDTIRYVAINRDARRGGGREG